MAPFYWGVGIIIVDLPTWFHHEQEKNASRGYHRERN